MKNDYLKWGALLFALVATASAEYELARAVGFNQWVAAAVPGALDIYTVRALRAGRDVLAAVGAMIGVNAASHLVTAGLLPVNVPLVVAVSAIAPLVLWRVHRLTDEDAETVKLDVIQLEESTKVDRVPEVYPAIETAVPAVPEAVPAGVRLLPIVARPEPKTLDNIQGSPVPVLAAEQPRTRPEVHAEYVPEPDEDPLTAAGLGWAAEQFKGQLFDGNVPSIRDIKNRLSVGQDRAKEIQEAFREALPRLVAEGATA